MNNIEAGDLIVTDEDKLYIVLEDKVYMHTWGGDWYKCKCILGSKFEMKSDHSFVRTESIKHLIVKGRLYQHESDS